LISVGIASSHPQNYTGYKVLRLKIDANDMNTYSQLDSIINEYDIAVWAQNLPEGWKDIMIHESLDPVFQQYEHVVKIEDVQKTLEEAAVEREKAKSENPDAFFTHFPTYAEVVKWLNDQVTAYPGVAKRITIGTSYLGKDIAALSLSKGSTAKKVIVYTCTIHAREWITTTSCCYAIEQLLTTDQYLLDSYEFNIIPVLNVDGYEYSHQSPSTRLWRKNRQPNTGSTCIGTDLNRNYGYRWASGGSSANPCSDTYHGGSPLSGREVLLVTSFLDKLADAGRLVGFVDIHAYGAMFMSCWGYTTAYPPGYDDMDAVMKKASDAIYAVGRHRYAYGTIANVIYIASGGSTDWQLGTYGLANAYAIEAFGNSFEVPASQIEPIGREIWAGLKAMAEAI